MSELWTTQDTDGSGAVTDAGYADYDESSPDWAPEAYAEAPGPDDWAEAQGGLGPGSGWAGPTWPEQAWPAPVSCCGCDEPGWAEDVVAAIPTEPVGEVTSLVVVDTPPAEPWSGWADVAADPGAAVLSVGAPLPAEGLTVLDPAGTPVDPTTVHPAAVTVGGNPLQPTFVSAAPGPSMADLAAQLGGATVVGGSTPAFTVLDAAGAPVDPGALLGPSVVGPPTAGLALSGSNGATGYAVLAEAAARLGNPMAQALANLGLGLNSGGRIWGLPDNTALVYRPWPW